jgi:membrane protein implicated in regulation of membrane protease activity
VPLSNNWLLVGAVVAAQAVHILSMFVPGWSGLLGIEPVSIATWGALLGIAVTKFASVEIYKAVRGRKLAERIDRTPPMSGRRA